jgi:hypothetical protein
MTKFSLFPQPKVVASNTMNFDPDLLNDDLSSATGIETLLAHDLMLEDLPASSKGPEIHHIGGVRYLAVDQTANRHQGFEGVKDLAT